MVQEYSYTKYVLGRYYYVETEQIQVSCKIGALTIMKLSERSGVLERARATYSVLRLASLAVIVVSFTAYCAAYEEAGAFTDPPDKSRLLSRRDCELPDFNSVIRADMHRLFEAPAPAQEDPCLPQADPEIHGISTAALEEFSATIHKHFEDNYIVGAEFLVIKSGHTIMHEACGWVDREELKPTEPNTIFNIRSMTKMLTGASAQILIDEGKLSLDDKVSQYLPGFDNRKSGGITIEQLLTHRSGLPLSTVTSLEEFDDLYSFGNSIGEKGPEFTPGGKFWYSDAGSEALGAVVEVVSGATLDRFVIERLLYPLDMNDTFYVTEPEAPLDRFASLYIGTPGSWEKWWIPGEPFYPFAWGSQSLYSTPVDYARFISMLMNGGTYNGERILSADAVDRILTPASVMTSLGSDMPEPTGFPFTDVYYGQMSILNISSDGQLQVFGHSGSDGTWAWAFPEHDMMIFYFTQSRGQVTGIRLETDLDRLLVNPEYAPPPEVVEKYQPYLGTYISESGASKGERFTVLIHNERLGFDIPGLFICELKDPLADEERWHFQLGDGVSIQFIRDRSGEIAGLRFYEPGYTHRMTKVSI
ncbi:MAG: serine hydrolase domain-containing protein [Planctomycetota bacterium]|jgi:CubicO group peptidase (beta-lactamase class C family)